MTIEITKIKYLLAFVFFLNCRLTYSQCENLKGDSLGVKNWTTKYQDYFRCDSTTPLIKADSVLIYYLYNAYNETNYGMPCCYYLAEKYAKLELAGKLKILYGKLEPEDSTNFSKAQNSWQVYYDNEWEFLRQSFIAYANLSKYGQGREIMIHTQSWKYQIIKDRILTIMLYIEIASNVE